MCIHYYYNRALTLMIVSNSCEKGNPIGKSERHNFPAMSKLHDFVSFHVLFLTC